MIESVAKLGLITALFWTFISVITAPSEALAAQTHEVEILRGSTTLADKAYSPNPIEIGKGDTIRFVNMDSVLHTATSGDSATGTAMPSGIFDSGFLGPNRAAEVTINEVGEIPYYCQAHPTMIGLVKVSEGIPGDDLYRVITSHDGQEYEVSGSNNYPARAKEVAIDPGVSVTVVFEGSGDAELTFPTTLIQGINSVATNDGTAVPFTKTNESDSSTTIRLTVPGGDRSIVISGTRVVPEFSAIAAFLVAGSLSAMIIVTTRTFGIKSDRRLGF